MWPTINFPMRCCNWLTAKAAWRRNRWRGQISSPVRLRKSFIFDASHFGHCSFWRSLVSRNGTIDCMHSSFSNGMAPHCVLLIWKPSNTNCWSMNYRHIWNQFAICLRKFSNASVMPTISMSSTTLAIASWMEPSTFCFMKSWENPRISCMYGIKTSIVICQSFPNSTRLCDERMSFYQVYRELYYPLESECKCLFEEYRAEDKHAWNQWLSSKT